jgi:membrane fusion protein, multidrug efflux system
MIPGPAIVAGAEGTQVAVVENGVARFKKVEIGLDLGSEVEISTGLTGDEQVIANPGERVAEGVPVGVAGDTAKKPAVATTVPTTPRPAQASVGSAPR